MSAFLRAVRDFALLVARIVIGVVLVARGWHRWQVTGIAEQAGIIEAAGLPSASTLAWAVIAFELIGGLLLIFGLGTPLIGLGIALQNFAVAYLTKDGFYAHEDGWEYNVVFAVAGLLLMAHGSGRLGLDHLFVRPKDDADGRLIDERGLD